MVKIKKETSKYLIIGILIVLVYFLFFSRSEPAIIIKNQGGSVNTESNPAEFVEGDMFVLEANGISGKNVTCWPIESSKTYLFDSIVFVNDPLADAQSIGIVYDIADKPTETDGQALKIHCSYPVGDTGGESFFVHYLFYCGKDEVKCDSIDNNCNGWVDEGAICEETIKPAKVFLSEYWAYGVIGVLVVVVVILIIKKQR